MSVGRPSSSAAPGNGAVRGMQVAVDLVCLAGLIAVTGGLLSPVLGFSRLSHGVRGVAAAAGVGVRGGGGGGGAARVRVALDRALACRSARGGAVRGVGGDAGGHGLCERADQPRRCAPAASGPASPQEPAASRAGEDAAPRGGGDGPAREDGRDGPSCAAGVATRSTTRWRASTAPPAYRAPTPRSHRARRRSARPCGTRSAGSRTRCAS